MYVYIYTYICVYIYIYIHTIYYILDIHVRLYACTSAAAGELLWACVMSTANIIYIIYIIFHDVDSWYVGCATARMKKREVSLRKPTYQEST